MNDAVSEVSRHHAHAGKTRMPARLYLFAVLVAAPTIAFAAPEQHQSGEAAYLQLCAPCHVDTVSGEGGGAHLAPTREAIGFMSSKRVRRALATSPKSDYVGGLSPETLEELMAFLLPDSLQK